MGWLIRAALGVLAMALLSGCGGSSKDDDDTDSGTCEDAAVCGGDVVGDWTIDSSCLDVDTAQMVGSSSCPGTTAQASDWNVTGSITFRDDLTYSSATTVSGNVIVTLPAACLTQQGVTLSCAQVQDALESSLADSNFSSARCKVSAGSGCACTLGLLPISSNASGTYTTTTAGILTQSPTGGMSSTSAYCVQGSTMTLSPDQMSMDNVSGSISLTRQ
jgi:hypothetical protein